MEQDGEGWTPTPTEVVGHRVRELRRLHGWTAQTLANKCDRAGVMGLTRLVITKLETGHRSSVSVDELVGLAAVFGVPPAELLLPGLGVVQRRGQDGAPEEVAGYRITSTEIIPVRDVRGWMTDRGSLPGRDRSFHLAQLHAAEALLPREDDPPMSSGGGATRGGSAVLDEAGLGEILASVLRDRGVELRKIGESSGLPDDDEGDDGGEGR